MALLEDIKKELFITKNHSDTQINHLILACKSDLEMRGILTEKIIDTDESIYRAIAFYVTGNWANFPDAEKRLMAYERHVLQMLRNSYYNGIPDVVE